MRQGAKPENAPVHGLHGAWCAPAPSLALHARAASTLAASVAARRRGENIARCSVAFPRHPDDAPKASKRASRVKAPPACVSVADPCERGPAPSASVALPRHPEDAPKASPRVRVFVGRAQKASVTFPRHQAAPPKPRLASHRRAAATEKASVTFPRHPTPRPAPQRNLSRPAPRDSDDALRARRRGSAPEPPAGPQASAWEPAAEPGASCAGSAWVPGRVHAVPAARARRGGAARASGSPAPG